MRSVIHWYRKSVNPPYAVKDLPAIFVTFLFLIGVPVLVLSTQESQSVRQLAAVSTSPYVVFVNSANTPITETTSANVRVSLTSPWPTTLSQATLGGLEEQNVLAEASAVYQVGSSTDDVNQDGSSFETSSSTVFLGNGQSTSYTGLRYQGVTIPRGATIKSAWLQMRSSQSQWVRIRLNIAADNTGNSQTFTSSSRPSQRLLTSQKVNHSSNTRWASNTWYNISDVRSVLQAVTNRSDWQPGNSVSLIIRGTGGRWGRKFANSYENSAENAPRLVVAYATGTDTQPTPTPTKALATSTPTRTPTATNTPTPTRTPTPTPVPVTESITLAEDSSFTVNVQNVSYTAIPTVTSYTFQNANPGVKTLYAKFRSSSGVEQVFSSSINLVSTVTLTPTPTKIPSPTPKSDPTTGTIWGVVETSMLGECSSAEHDKYVIDGKDGFLYRTWHPQVDPSGCVFAHEHGDDPDTMKDTWVRANWDPRFGYAARRMTSAAEPNGHVEGHDGYKVFSANIGLTNDEGRVNRTASLSTFHMGTGGPKRFTVQHHSNSIAYRYQTGAPYSATHLMLDTGGVSDVCDPRASAPTKDALTLQNRCKVNSPYEIWGTFQTIKSGSREIYRVFVTPAAFDPITVFNRDNPLETVYAWDPRVAAIKNFNNDWSSHRGCKRENYAQIGNFYNAGGPTIYYTDPMGNVVPQSNVNAIMQIVSATNSVGLASTQDNIQFKMPTSYCQNRDKLGLKN